MFFLLFDWFIYFIQTTQNPTVLLGHDGINNQNLLENSYKECTTYQKFLKIQTTSVSPGVLFAEDLVLCL